VPDQLEVGALLTLNNHMEQSSYWEADNFFASQEIPILWNTQVYNRIHKNRPSDPILSRINTVHALIPFPAVPY
jgi:hypothetical protein